MTLETALFKQQMFPNKNMMGNRGDIDYLKIDKRQRKVNNHFKNNEWFDWNCKIEIKRLVSQLSLSDKLEARILKRFYTYYNQIDKWHKFRTKEYLCPLTIYILTRENFIFIRKDLLILEIKAPLHQKPKKIFKEGLTIILKNNRHLIKLFRGDQFRKKYILSFMIRFFPLNKIQPILDEYWNILKKTKDIMIMGILLYLLLPNQKRSPIIRGSLGIRPGSVCNFIRNNMINTRNCLIKYISSPT